MSLFKITHIPVILAALPFLALALMAISELSVFDWLGGLSDALSVIFFLGPALFYKNIGLIPFNILGGTPTLFGSSVLAQIVYAATAAIVLFLIGHLIRKVLGH